MNYKTVSVTIHVERAKSPCSARCRGLGQLPMDAHPPLPPEIWEHTPPAAQAMIVAQAALAQLQAELVKLQATVAELAQRRWRNARYSSRPPLMDPPQTTRLRHERSERRPGGNLVMSGRAGRWFQRPICCDMERLLEASQQGGMPETKGVCREILKVHVATLKPQQLNVLDYVAAVCEAA
jgi:hypothetical protein